MPDRSKSTQEAGFNLEKYLTRGVENIVKGAVRASLKEPRESAFMARFALASKAASKKRAEAEIRGEHIPPFLIASITSSCNLHCAGCHARQNHTCTDGKATAQLTANEWKDIFTEAKELGIGFILLAGGEPLIRRDVLGAAGDIPEILFPVFTKGTLIDDEYIKLSDHSRNLVPVFNIEGEEEKTDGRRGTGVYQKLISAIFLGDEESSGGCLAAGRGFFHINSHGGAEPCLFSLYSDINVRDTSLRQALNSLMR